MLTRALLGLALFTMVACGGDDDGDGGGGVTCAQAAAAIGDCGVMTTEAEFNETCETVRYPDACLSAIAAADCEQHDLDEPTYADTCFPACNPADPTVCNDDGSITLCDPDTSTEITFYCEAVCEQVAQSPYTGTCGPEYMGMQSESGQSTCWCE